MKVSVSVLSTVGIILLQTTSVGGFIVPSNNNSNNNMIGTTSSTTALAVASNTDEIDNKAAAAAAAPSAAVLYNPKERDSYYQQNIAQYLVDLHDSKATFDFCGGMMFQLVLTDQLREYLQQVATNNNNNNKQQPFVFDMSKPRMHMTPNYQQNSMADNQFLFHGREIRQVPTAAGGMNMVLQLSMANDNNNSNDSKAKRDPQGWTVQEVDRYNGWTHDVGREWRRGSQLTQEGYQTFVQEFGSSAYSLHHRFYLHYDFMNRLWLSAEDGCEGTPSPGKDTKNIFSNFFGFMK